MFEGKGMMDYFEIGHQLSEKNNLSLTEYNAMLPWHLSIKVALIARDFEDKKARMAKQQNPFDAAMQAEP